MAQGASLPLPLAIGLGATIAVCLALLAATGGQLAVALALPAAAAALVALVRAPLRLVAHLILFVALLADNPIERPGQNLYQSPLLPVGALLYETLNRSLHLSGLKLSGIQALIILMGAVAGLRMLFGVNTDGRVRMRAAAPFLRACLVSVATLLALEAMGVATGGSVPHSIFQLQTLICVPVMAMIFAYAFKHPSDLSGLLTTLLTVAVVRALMCVYYFVTVVQGARKGGGQSGDGSYVTTHSDSILAAVAIVVCIAWVYQEPSPRAFLRAAAVVPLVALGIVLNNRRIAFVAVGLGLLFCYLAAQPGFRRRVQRTVLTALPFLLMYIAVGWGAHGGWAKPVQTLKSVMTQKDTSSATRDIENFNLMQTWKARPLTGWGFGHEYLEAVKAFDISKIFEAYRFVPHNSFLWLWGVGGLVGFTFYWMYLSVGLFMAARVILFAQRHEEAMASMAAIGAVVAYSVQSFGDMGMMSWMGALIVAATLGAQASAATRLGAWVNGGRRRVGADPGAAPSQAPL